METNKYLEMLYKIKIWVLRGNTSRAKAIFENLPDADRDFRKLKELNSAICNENLEELKKIFEIRVPQYIQNSRKIYPKAYCKWTTEENLLLKEQYEAKVPIDSIAKTCERSPRAICERLIKYLKIVNCVNCDKQILESDPYARQSNGELVHYKCLDKTKTDNGAEEDHDNAVAYCDRCLEKHEQVEMYDLEDDTMLCEDCYFEMCETEEEHDTLSDWWKELTRDGGMEDQGDTDYSGGQQEPDDDNIAD